MKLNIYCYYNNLGGFFGKPFYEVAESDIFVAQFVQSMFGATDEVLDSLKEDDLYFLGTFDNVTGELVSKKEFLAHVGEIANTIIAKKAALGDTNAKEN